MTPSIPSSPIRLSRPLISVACAVSALAFLVSGARASEARAQTDARDVLARACAKLASLRQYRVAGQRTVDPGLAVGSTKRERLTFEAIISKPHRYVVHMRGSGGIKHIYSTPEKVTLHWQSLNECARLPGARTLDALVAGCERDFGFTPPLDYFIVADPLARLQAAASTIRAEGVEGVRGVACHKIVLGTKDRVVTLWIGKDDMFPRRSLDTHPRLAGAPGRDTFYTTYETLASVEPAQFEFVAPEGCQRCELSPTRAGSRD